MYRIIVVFFSAACLCFGFASNALGARTPILIMGAPGSFDAYTGEILKTEGFNSFQVESLASPKISLKYLKQFEVVLLTETAVSDSQKEILIAFVAGGGRLIAFRPDKKLASLFGLKHTGSELNEAYLGIDGSSVIGKGLIAETLQLHSVADAYELAGGKKIASLYSHSGEATPYAAVSLNEFGKGRAIAFTFNLAKSIAFTRQGNYLFAGQEKDSILGLRAMDLFTYGWVDTSKNTLNQADEQMRLLTHCLEWMNGFSKPLPRFWYFPDDLQCLVTLNNDGESSFEKDIEPQFADIEAKGANMTLYILETEKVSKEAVDSWIKRGNEISGHPNDTKNAERPDWANMNEAIDVKLGELKSKYDIRGMQTIVNHWFVWCGNDVNGKRDFSAQAKIEASKGIGMDINYAHYDNNSNQFRFLGPLGAEQGNYNGSGLPLKFTDEQGGLVNIYQVLNSVYDQQYMENNDSLGFFNCFKGLMDRSLNGSAYSYITVKCHNDEYFFSKTPLSKMLDYANANHIPVWTCAKLLGFLKAKDEASFNDIKWSGNKLSFQIQSTLSHSHKLTCMIPVFKGRKINEVSVGGLKTDYTIKTVKGTDYAFFTVKPGSDYQVTVVYGN